MVPHVDVLPALATLVNAPGLRSASWQGVDN